MYRVSTFLDSIYLALFQTGTFHSTLEQKFLPTYNFSEKFPATKFSSSWIRFTKFEISRNFRFLWKQIALLWMYKISQFPVIHRLKHPENRVGGWVGGANEQSKKVGCPYPESESSDVRMLGQQGAWRRGACATCVSRGSSSVSRVPLAVVDTALVQQCQLARPRTKVRAVSWRGESRSSAQTRSRGSLAISSP